MNAHNRVDMTGQKINMLTVIRPIKKSHRPKALFWECICDCGNTTIVNGSCLRREKKNISCGCHRIKRSKEAMWQGYGEIGKSYWSKMRYGAIDRHLEFSVTIEDGWNLFLQQNRKCSLTGLSLTFARCIKTRPKDQTASLDRINSKRGYTRDNIVWVHKAVNRLKWDMSNEELIYWSNLISQHHLASIKSTLSLS